MERLILLTSKRVLAKVQEDKRTENCLYQSGFFYSVRHHFIEKPNEYRDLGDCVVNGLKLQETHETYEKDAKEKTVFTERCGGVGTLLLKESNHFIDELLSQR